MSEVHVNHILQTMREVSREARGIVVAEAVNENVGFQDLFSQAINRVNDIQMESKGLKEAFQRGEDVSLAEVMLTSQKAGVSFQAMLQVRNKLVNAYQEVMNMPI